MNDPTGTLFTTLPTTRRLGPDQEKYLRERKRIRVAEPSWVDTSKLPQGSGVLELRPKAHVDLPVNDARPSTRIGPPEKGDPEPARAVDLFPILVVIGATLLALGAVARR